ncbi:transposase, partial [Nocardia sp. NPDC059239]|uniref:transposase n=1 Tax=Nocardia sp. NPDC059239 TaxID=3346785 RepID=UPI0036ACEA3E
MVDRFRPGHGRRLAYTGEKLGGAATGPSPVDRAETGSKHHILTCGNGFPLAVALSAANVNDHLLLPTLLDRVQPLRGRPGPPRRRICQSPRSVEASFMRPRLVTGPLPRPRGRRPCGS